MPASLLAPSRKDAEALARHLQGDVGATRRVLTERGGIGRTEQFTAVRLR